MICEGFLSGVVAGGVRMEKGIEIGSWAQEDEEEAAAPAGAPAPAAAAAVDSLTADMMVYQWRRLVRGPGVANAER